MLHTTGKASPVRAFPHTTCNMFATSSDAILPGGWLHAAHLNLHMMEGWKAQGGLAMAAANTVGSATRGWTSPPPPPQIV